MPDQYHLYDVALKDWVTTEFLSILPGKTADLMIGTPDRAFAEYVTPTPLDPDGRPPVPRIALTLEDPEVDPERFNPNTIRKLGWNEAEKLKIRRGEYPTPVNKPYTLNFWTEYRREMNLFSQYLMYLFKPGYHYIDVDIDTIDPNDIYGTKKIGLFSDSGMVATGDLEPGNKERIIRRTFTFTLKGWLWDLGDPKKGPSPVPNTAYALKEVEIQTYSDEDLTQLLSTSSIPQRQTVFTAAAGQDTYTGSVDTEILPVIANTFLIDATIGGNNKRGYDDGAGNLIGDEIASGTLDYNTGALTVTFSTIPDTGTPITAAYFTTID